jgi:hypothetical protein
MGTYMDIFFPKPSGNRNADDMGRPTPMISLPEMNVEEDITVRLRRGFGGIVPPISDEAANEIERLRLLQPEKKLWKCVCGAREMSDG